MDTNELRIINKIARGAMGGVIDSALSSTPGVAIVWSAVKGGVNAIRTNRAETFLLFAENHINIKMFDNPQFIDGFSITFEEFIKQRNEEKRRYIQSIFKGYIEYEFDDDFEMERMYDCLNKISNKHIIILKEMHDKKDRDLIISSDKAGKWGNDIIELNKDYSEIKYLEYLGLVKVDVMREMKEEPEYEGDEESGLHVVGQTYSLTQVEKAQLSEFGKIFISYLNK